MELNLKLVRYVANALCVNMGAAGPIAVPQIQCWFRMAIGAWSVIGFLFTAAFMFPRKYRNLIPLLAVGTLAEGFFLLSHGMLLRVSSLPFYGFLEPHVTNQTVPGSRKAAVARSSPP